MTYVKLILSTVAAVFLALMVPAVYFLFWTMRSQQVTGLAAVSGGIVECLQAPVFWILGVSLFVLFLAASRLQAQALRVIFFWTPAVSASAMSALLVVGYAWMRSRHG